MDTGQLIISIVWTDANGEVRNTHIKVVKPQSKTVDEALNHILDAIDETANEYF